MYIHDLYLRIYNINKYITQSIIFIKQKMDGSTEWIINIQSFNIFNELKA